MAHHREKHPSSVDGCIACKILGLKTGPGVYESRRESIDRFWATGDPAVFASPGDPDYDPAVSSNSR